jgi:hypothetical protein
MQIHEITQRNIDEGLGSMVGGLAGGISNLANKVAGAVSPVGAAKNAYASAVKPQQIKMIADKAYNGWKQYEKTLLQSNPDARTTGMYEQALLAFVVKNLLSGQYLPNVINKDKITALVKQLSSSGQGSAPAQEPPQENPAQKNPATTPPATKQPRTKKAPANAAGAGVFGQMANQLSEVAGALTPQQEKDLWLQLTQQAAVATSHAPGTASGGDGGSPKSPEPGAGDAHSYANQLAQYTQDPKAKEALTAFVKASGSQTGGINVKSTGNPVADALLISAGFRGL